MPKVLSFSIHEMKMYGLDGQRVTLNSNFICFQTIHVEVGKTALGNITLSETSSLETRMKTPS